MSNDDEISDYFQSNFSELQNAFSAQQMRRFIALDTNPERIDFVLNYPEVYGLSLDVDVEPLLKSKEKAGQLKELGNKYFGRGEFIKALETYSNAVLLAPREDLGVIFGNRSATLYHLEQHNHALTDIKEAKRVGYPKELLYKLEERRAKCLLGLKRHDEAVLAFRSALKFLDESKLLLEKKLKLEADIRVMLAVIDKGNELARKEPKTTQLKVEKEKPHEVKKLTPQIENCNPLYPSCTEAVEIRDEGGDIGRHAVAAKDIEPGEIIAIENPYCSFLLAEYRLTHCHYCFTRIFVPLPAACAACSCIAYCSISCRDKDAKIHEIECKILPDLWISRTSINCFLALRVITKQPFDELMKHKEKMKNMASKLEVSVERPYRSDDFETFCGLLTHEDERTAEDLLHRTYIAIWLLRLLKKTSYIPEDVKTPDAPGHTPSEVELWIGGLLLHSLMLLQFNSHEISELIIPKGSKSMKKSKSNFIAGGIYSTIALFNHSCNPGVIRYFNGITMIVRAIRSISAGEEISENYGPIFTITPETERKRKLRWQYWFDCNCEACAGHWPLLEEIDPTILRFKCETGKECGNILPIKTDTEEFMIRCSKCGKSTNILKGLKALQDTDAIFKVASRNLEEGNHEEAFKSYLNILKILDENLALPIRDYHLCQNSVRLCCLHFGNVSFV
ncbi:SET and MYND domain-containing protein 4-like [Ceratina calcarata]|uniref:Protein-lysine N-methyltransferase SMYD4 n=1 Tax=Ceratina calcarata TaxID=156304 RepID=A0AAJ7NAR1_9HYME|nr:SET and MYND domain-containing protein 4-like [Ceratina calcarata]